MIEYTLHHVVYYALWAVFAGLVAGSVYLFYQSIQFYLEVRKLREKHEQDRSLGI